MSKSELLFSATIAAIYLISCTRELSPENNEEFLKKGIQINSNFGGKYKFLTILNLVNVCTFVLEHSKHTAI